MMIFMNHDGVFFVTVLCALYNLHQLFILTVGHEVFGHVFNFPPGF